MTESASHFLCRLCNRRYRWSTAVAGKKLRCHCGETIAVPAISPDAAPPAHAKHQPDYAPADGNESSSSMMAVFAHPLRNLIFPAVYAIGALVVFFTCLPQLFGTLPAVGACILLLGSTLVLAGGFLIYGLIRGRQMEIKIGSFAVAAFKILAIVLVTDAVAIALSTYWVNIGVFSRHMKLTIFLLLSFPAIYIAVIGIVLWVASWGVFNNQDDDFVAAGFPIAAGGWAAHFVLFIGTIIGIHVYKVATYVPPPPPPPPPAPVNTGPPPLPVTDADAKIIERIHRGFIVIEGRHWAQMRIKNDHGVAALVETMYNAGADRVYVDMESSYMDGHPSKVYVQLPDNPAQQGTCKTAADKVLAGTPTLGAPGEYQKFIAMPIN
jgi:hypothetical protein